MADQNWWEEKDGAPEPKSGGLSEEEAEMIASLIKEKGSVGKAGPYLAIVEVNALLRDFARNREADTTRWLTRDRWGGRLLGPSILTSLAYVIGVLFFGLSSTLEPIIPGYDYFGTVTQACCFWPVFFLPGFFIFPGTPPRNATLMSELKEEYPNAAKHYDDASLFGRPDHQLPAHIRTSQDHQTMSWDWVTCSHHARCEGNTKSGVVTMMMRGRGGKDSDEDTVEQFGGVEEMDPVEAYVQQMVARRCRAKKKPGSDYCRQHQRQAPESRPDAEARRNMEEWELVTLEPCSEKVPSWEGVAEGNRCNLCRGVFCPHHFIFADAVTLAPRSRSEIRTTVVCNSCVSSRNTDIFGEVAHLRSEGRSSEAFFLARRMAAEGIDGALELVEEIMKLDLLSDR